MNEVMCLAEDNGIKVFYQDTDSMMLYDKNVGALGNLFKEEYGRELIGEAMGQFHTDFEVYDEFGKKIKAKSLLAGGESGNLTSKHFKDQAEMYNTGKFRKMKLNKAEIVATSTKLVFIPNKK